jgi:hypothetical protein
VVTGSQFARIWLSAVISHSGQCHHNWRRNSGARPGLQTKDNHYTYRPDFNPMNACTNKSHALARCASFRWLRLENSSRRIITERTSVHWALSAACMLRLASSSEIYAIVPRSCQVT